MTNTTAGMAPQVVHLEAGDEIVLKYLGAAVVLQWQGFTNAVRESLLQQADSVGGLPPVEHLHDQIKALIARARE